MNREIPPGVFFGIVAVLAIGLLTAGYWFVVKPSGSKRDTGYRPPLPPPPGSLRTPGAVGPHTGRAVPSLPAPPPAATP